MGQLILQIIYHYGGIQIACIENGKTVASVISLPRIDEFLLCR